MANVDIDDHLVQMLYDCILIEGPLLEMLEQAEFPIDGKYIQLAFERP